MIDDQICEMALNDRDEQRSVRKDAVMVQRKIWKLMNGCLQLRLDA